MEDVPAHISGVGTRSFSALTNDWVRAELTHLTSDLGEDLYLISTDDCQEILTSADVNK